MNTQKQHNSFHFNPNDLVLMIGESMGANASNSIQFAQKLALDGRYGKVLHINTLQRRKKYRRTIHEMLGADYAINQAHTPLIFESFPIGDLADEIGMIDTMVTQCNIKTLVVNCWELATRDYRTRQKLMFEILRWQDDFELTIILYAQTSSVRPRAGYAMRGGFGKLSGIADVVLEDLPGEKSNAEVEVAPVSPGTILMLPAGREEAMETGVSIEEYLAQYQRTQPVHVHNDVVEREEVADLILQE